MYRTIQWYPGQGGERTGWLEYIWTDRQTDRLVGYYTYLQYLLLCTTYTHSYSYVKTQLGLRGWHCFKANEILAVRILHGDETPFWLRKTKSYRFLVCHWSVVALLLVASPALVIKTWKPDLTKHKSMKQQVGKEKVESRIEKSKSFKTIFKGERKKIRRKNMRK